MSHKRVAKIVTSKDEWQTPQWLFDLLDQEFHFNLDAAADYDNSKVDGWFDEEANALEQDWQDCEVGRVWLNPPYSAGNIDRFMAKALEESQKGAIVVCLVPCATDTKWWHNYAMKAQEIRFIKGRVRFVGYDENGKQIKNSPTFSSCVVIFDKSYNELYQMPFNHNPFIGKTIEQPRSVKT